MSAPGGVAGAQRASEAEMVISEPCVSVRARVLVGGLYERTSGAAGQPLTGYRRRSPERTVLHELVAGLCADDAR